MRYETIYSIIANRAGAKTIGCVHQSKDFTPIHTSSRLVGMSFGIQYFLFKFTLPL